MSLNNGILLKEVLITGNNPQAFCYFMNLDFLLFLPAHLDNSMIFPFLVHETSGFYFLYSFFISSNIILLSNFNRFYASYVSLEF